MIEVTREQYQEALDDLRADVRALGDLVLEQLERGLTAMGHRDDALARTVIAGDDEVNRRYLGLESDCIDLLALQQPVAGDLRFVVASFKILTDLERVGDLATNFGTYALAASVESPADIDVYRIGVAARDLFADALDAYEDGDPAACRAVAAGDDEIDDSCRRAGETVVRDLLGRDPGADPTIDQLTDEVSRVLLAVRDLERVGDHAVNVAARTLYAVESDPELIY